MKSFNPSIFSCTLNWRLTPRINGIPHFLLNCHENYWDSPISSLTGSWDSPILTLGLWDSPCPFLPFSEGLFFLLRVFGIPQFSPGVYGIPHALFRLSPKVFCFWNCHIHCDIAWISTGLSISAARPRSLRRHRLYLEFEHALTFCNHFLRTTQHSTLKTFKTFPSSSMNFQMDYQEFEGSHFHHQRQKRRKSFYTETIQRRSSRLAVEMWRGKCRLSLRGGRPPFFPFLFALAFLSKAFLLTFSGPIVPFPIFWLPFLHLGALFQLWIFSFSLVLFPNFPLV